MNAHAIPHESKEREKQRSEHKMQRAIQREEPEEI